MFSIWTFWFCPKMIFTSRHLEFFRIRHIGMTQYFSKWFHSSFCPWKHRCRHQNYDSMSFRSGNIAQIRFSWHLKKWPKPISRLKVILRNIANNIPKNLLIKMHSGGGAWWPIPAHGLSVSIINSIKRNIICSSKNSGHFEFRMILTSGHINTLSNRFSTLKNPPTGYFDHQNWPTGAKHIDI